MFRKPVSAAGLPGRSGRLNGGRRLTTANAHLRHARKRVAAFLPLFKTMGFFKKESHICLLVRGI
jgi:hypothetical protein